MEKIEYIDGYRVLKLSDTCYRIRHAGFFVNVASYKEALLVIKNKSLSI